MMVRDHYKSTTAFEQRRQITLALQRRFHEITTGTMATANVITMWSKKLREAVIQEGHSHISQACYSGDLYRPS